VVASSAALPPLSVGPLPLAALRDHPLVMFRTGYDLRDSTVDACRRAGFEPVFAAEGGEMDAVLAFVAAGVGVAVVPSLVASGRPELRVTPLATPGLTRTIHLAHRRDVTPTHAAQAFRGELRRYLTEAAAWQHGGNIAALISPHAADQTDGR
jgi:DNA-binding transcriptional LysR family regulator